MWFVCMSGNERRKLFVEKELPKYSPEVNDSLNKDTLLNEKQKYHLLLVLSDYRKKYSKNLGAKKTDEVLKTLDYSDLKSLYDCRKHFGYILTPTEITEKLEYKEKILPKLEARHANIKNFIVEKAGLPGCDIELLFPINTQYTLMREYYRVGDIIKDTKADLKVLSNVSKSAKEFEKVRPLTMTIARKPLAKSEKAFCM